MELIPLLGLRDLLKQESLKVGRELMVFKTQEYFTGIGEIHPADLVVTTPVTETGKQAVFRDESPRRVLAETVGVGVTAHSIYPKGKQKSLIASFETFFYELCSFNQVGGACKLSNGQSTVCYPGSQLVHRQILPY